MLKCDVMIGHNYQVMPAQYVTPQIQPIRLFSFSCCPYLRKVVARHKINLRIFQKANKDSSPEFTLPDFNRGLFNEDITSDGFSVMPNEEIDSHVLG